MNDEEMTNGRRGALALHAISLYARSSRQDGPDEEHFIFDSDTGAEPGAAAGGLSALLCGLMHYAGHRKLSFDGALASARRDYQQQRTALLPGDAVRRTDPAWPGSPADRPLTGEITRARPGSPPVHLVDFITTREWLAEQHLTPAPGFMTVPTESGDLRSAHVARFCLSRLIAQIESDWQQDRRPDAPTIRDFRTLLVALSNWSGVARPRLLASFSQVITEEGGWLIAGSRTTHPVSLAVADIPLLPAGILPADTSSPAPQARPGTTARRPPKRGR